ncbi:hypothetical protein INR49_021843 [Caranx melampygus]|nr:hypothetical protein INR49_021843 [Caranx melampygus]
MKKCSSSEVHFQGVNHSWSSALMSYSSRHSVKCVWICRESERREEATSPTSEPPLDQQSSLPKCPLARHCFSTTSRTPDIQPHMLWEASRRTALCVFLGDVMPSGG